MATRAKPREIVAESQKVFGVIRKGLKWIGITTAIATAIVVTVLSVRDRAHEESLHTVSTSVESEKVMVLTMLANGDSIYVFPKTGKVTSFTGVGFTTHCVYTDGTEGVVGDQLRPCHDGPMLYQYVRDTTGHPNSVTYMFARP